MTVPTDKTYPALATNKSWQSKKSTGDKILTSTDLGASLTEAEKQWKLIDWDTLETPDKGAVKALGAAQIILRNATKAEAQVTKANNAVKGALAKARAAATNKSLSAKTKTAAANIATALKGAADRLDKVNINAHKQLVTDLAEAAEKPIEVTKIGVYSDRKEVASGAKASWDRKSGKLTVANIKWVGTAASFKGKTLTVAGTVAGNEHYEGISKVFQNDMKLDGSSTDTFVSAN
jgi:hypothetical protein